MVAKDRGMGDNRSRDMLCYDNIAPTSYASI